MSKCEVSKYAVAIVVGVNRFDCSLDFIILYFKTQFII